METHVQSERYPSLVKSCSDYEDQVKEYIRHFENAESVKKNLQNKMKIAFSNVRGKRKEDPGIQIDMQPLHAETRAMSSITATGWKTLSASVAQASNAFITHQVSSTCDKIQNRVAFTNKVQ